MAISRVSNSSVISNTPKKRSVLAGNDILGSAAYYSIATATVSGSASSVTFSNIPQTYTHLQIRGFSRSARAIAGSNIVMLRFNTDTTLANYYSTHNLAGDGGGTVYSQSIAAVGGSNAGTWGGISIGNSSSANIYSAFTTDILDYANTNKYKTTRSLQGLDDNSTSGIVYFVSGVWLSSGVIDSITLFDNTTNNLMQYSSFALYGIK